MGLKDCGSSLLVGFDEAVVVDVETTGLDPREDRIVALSLIRVDFSGLILGGEAVCQSQLNEWFNPNRRIPSSSSEIHGLHDADLVSMPMFMARAAVIRDYIGDSPLIGHNLEFDTSFLDAEFRRSGLERLDRNPRYCTMARMRAWRDTWRATRQGPNLQSTARSLGIRGRSRKNHDPAEDARITADIAAEFYKMDNLTRLQARRGLPVAEISDGARSRRSGHCASGNRSLSAKQDRYSRPVTPLTASGQDQGEKMAEVPAWGKFDCQTDSFHPDSFHRLEHHCADVAAVFLELVRNTILRDRFARAIDSQLTSTLEARLAVLAFLHDFGKLNSGFQFKVRDRATLPKHAPPPSGHIAEALVCCETQKEICCDLGLYDIFDAWGPGIEWLLRAALAHHGRPAEKRHESTAGPQCIWKEFAGYDPRTTAAVLGRRSREWFPNAFGDGPPLPESPSLAHLFAGTVAIADQVGSMDEFFPFEPGADPEYFDRACERAKRAVTVSGLLCAAAVSRTAPFSFRTLFQHPAPRPLQAAVAEAPLNCPLMVLESETGSGKTEAAVLRFAKLWQAGLVDGIYFAVPTRAAAKQLHQRVQEALARLFHADKGAATVLAVPGYICAGGHSGKPIGNYQVEWEDHPDEDQQLARWAAETPRRYLAARAAVGTVDQVLLAGLEVKWAHFRAAALARSLLVVDEAHASDTYMTELLCAVLQGHLAVGGYALLMSATLGSVARTKLCGTGTELGSLSVADAEAVPYPSVTLIRNGLARTDQVDESGRTKSVSMRTEPVIYDASAIADLALQEARRGAKVLVIRNTVSSAQAVFEAALQHGGGGLTLQVAGAPALHHSRFAAEDRSRLDAAVESALGKARGPGGIVVIGTQTLEQSLDVDADHLISDLCPVDVLLQRIGRLHRHERASRPATHAQPECIVLTPPDGLETGLRGGLAQHGLGSSLKGGVYRNLLCLEATRRLVAEHKNWQIPAMNRLLVERATHPDALRQIAESLGGDWQDEEQDNFGRAAAKRRLAQEHGFYRTKQRFDQDFKFQDHDGGLRTRLGEDGPRVELQRPTPGPFGWPVRTFNLPAHLFGGAASIPSKESIRAAKASPVDGGLEIRIGDFVFGYDRRGVRRLGSAR